jgi:thiamine biosynthesis lipoprotein
MANKSPELARPKVGTMNRRQFLKITAAASGLLIGGGLLKFGLNPSGHTLRETRTLMGTLINLVVIARTQHSAREAVEATFAEMARLIIYFDHRRHDAALARLNRAGRLSRPPANLVSLLELAQRYGDLTGGAFDVTVKPLLEAYQSGQSVTPSLHNLVDYRQVQVSPDLISLNRPGMALTLDGIAKGQVVDGATAVLRSRGFENILVEAGGDLTGLGNRADGSTWRVGIAHPRQAASGGLLGVLPLTDRAMASSGDYMHVFSQDWRHHHILDPRSGISPADLSAATVLAPAAADADALSTAMMVMGRRAGLALIERLPYIEALLVTKEMQLIRSSGFPSLA